DRRRPRLVVAGDRIEEPLDVIGALLEGDPVRREPYRRGRPLDRAIGDEEVEERVGEAGGAGRAGTARRLAAGLPDLGERGALVQRMRPVERREPITDRSRGRRPNGLGDVPAGGERDPRRRDDVYAAGRAALLDHERRQRLTAGARPPREEPEMPGVGGSGRRG